MTMRTLRRVAMWATFWFGCFWLGRALMTAALAQHGKPTQGLASGGIDKGEGAQ